MFEIEGKDISELSDSDLRSLIGLLCEADLRSMKLPTAGVTWGGHQNAKDGGIDVRVELMSSVYSDGFIPRSNTGYQVKKPDMPRSAIFKEMMVNGEPKQAIKDLIALNGAYIIVSSQGSTADSALKDRKDTMQEVVENFSHTSNFKVDFYDRERIAGWVRSFPALSIWVREKIGRPIRGWRTFGNWARSPGGLKEEYILDEQIRLYSSGNSHFDGLSALEGLNKLRSILERPKSNIRLVGLSGVGKTRLVQALFDNRIGSSPLNPSTVFYTDISDGPNPDPCTLAQRLVNLNSHATVIVDNCPPDLHNRLVAVGGEPNSLLSIVTVEYDVREDQPEETEVFRLEPASKELISHILKLRFSHLSEVNARTIAEFSGGNARIAIALANTVKRGENLAGLRDNVLFNRLFEQRNEPNFRLLQAAEVCSLVYSFDSSINETDSNELIILGSVVGMSTQPIYENVSELIRRDLVQKRSIWRAVLPHAIANKLAQRALENIPINIICNTFENGENERLLKSFSRRLSFLHDSEEAKEISNRWLNEGGLLGSVSNLNEFGISLLKNIAPVNQELVLASIEKVLLLEEANTFFSRDNPNYNEFTRLLCSIAYEQDYFERSSNLLCLFALSERPDENYNSIRKMLKTLFQLYLSGTKATPEQRLIIIDKLVVSNIHNERELGLLLLEVALKTDSFISDHYFEFGAHSRDYGLQPTTMKEIQHWYKVFIKYSLKLIMNQSPVSNKVKVILGRKFGSLWLKTRLYDELELCANKISEKGFWGEAWVAVKSVKKRNQETLDSSIESRLDELDKILKPTSLIEHVRLYVLSEDSFALVDTFDEKNSDDEDIKIEENAKSLGIEVGSNQEILKELLPDIICCKNWVMFNFGQGLAEGLLSSDLIWEEFISQLTTLERTTINYQVIRGFLSALSKNNPNLCNRILDDALTKKITAEVFPLLQTSIEIDESGVKRLIESLESGSSPIWQYSNLAYGRVHETINDGDFYKMIKLISSQSNGLEVAIKILHMRLHGQKKNEQHNKTIIGLGQELLSMYEFQRKTSRNDRSDYELSEIIKASYVTNSSIENAKILGDKLLKGFMSYDIYPWNYSRVLEALASTQPQAFLETFLESNEDNREVDTLFLDDLRTRANPISKINREVIIEWCESSPETRYLLLARVIMPYYKCKESNKLQWTPLALEILENFNEPIEILDTFKYSFLPRSWSGSLAAVMERRLPLIYELKEHQDRSVVNWAIKQQVELDGSIRQTRENELNEERRRNERFE
ncbi:hypothetical protein AJ85_08660 [Alkalihalobacillus alcalophilus ATCC 27647 = CGMCC 1.3604]|uniref:Uncharacterized protein n=1 Tax=Alkalihalobacillus alcalophilus ATCC 27647 = CGMCC 1.3604 TaxID=1218173 RepID=A0A094YS89_ALKAL|nr:hypothetical protein [Alkalihalobacillus alcalophilus]KGA96342.1 hypothetical protein BALCAV_0216910 [Alkalihalobacillus alcalophilus ATCC 27647 = CGMCC 1.3604]MED1560753.1 hypothetical protein [Alkalihalobacillus alcalophilus]THG90805.1 hypothetical protein AJ85_08660 [Alkalihalobacillus alcalophilus ATCC 27647 = CGMCC 1.3604]